MQEHQPGPASPGHAAACLTSASEAALSPADSLCRSSHEGEPCHLPQVALPQELTHRARRLEPKLHARSQHVVRRVPCTPTGRLPRTGTWPPFHHGCCRLQCLVMRPGALSLPLAPIRKPRGSSVPCTPQRLTDAGSPSQGQWAVLGLMPCTAGHHSHHRAPSRAGQWSLSDGEGAVTSPRTPHPLTSAQESHPQPPPPSTLVSGWPPCPPQLTTLGTSPAFLWQLQLAQPFPRRVHGPPGLGM